MSKTSYSALYTFSIPRRLKCSALQVQRFRVGLDDSLEYVDGQSLTVRGGRYYHLPTPEVSIEIWERDMHSITAGMLLAAAKGEVARKKPTLKGLPERFLLVGGLSPRTTSKELERHFSRFGHVVRVDLRREVRLAYVYLADVRDAEDALEGLGGKEVNGRRLLIEWARPTVNGN
jgi:hypothetical protein